MTYAANASGYQYACAAMRLDHRPGGQKRRQWLPGRPAGCRSLGIGYQRGAWPYAACLRMSGGKSSEHSKWHVSALVWTFRVLEVVDGNRVYFRTAILSRDPDIGVHLSDVVCCTVYALRSASCSLVIIDLVYK